MAVTQSFLVSAPKVSVSVFVELDLQGNGKYSQKRLSHLNTNYSIRAARICLSRISTSMPSGGRRSEPCTMAPRTHTLPGIFIIFSGSYTVWLHGLPNLGCFASWKP